jgi:hypothetical protein
MKLVCAQKVVCVSLSHAGQLMETRFMVAVMESFVVGSATALLPGSCGNYAFGGKLNNMRCGCRFGSKSSPLQTLQTIQIIAPSFAA